MIVVTGGAGFIGSNIVRSLNELGRDDVLVVDDLRDGHKIVNLADCDIVDYVDRDAFLERVVWGEELGRIDAVLHQGACSDTTEWDGTYVMRVNYEYSKALLHWCAERSVPFIYASSASVYGAGPEFVERREHERPLNMYAYSKFQFDQYVRRRLPDLQTQVAGLRYFNVYGPREQHKGRMASVAWRFDRQIVEGGRARLFCGSDGYGDGEQRRDFVWVGDVVAVNLWLLEHPGVSGLFNVGSGRAQTFNDVARAVIDFHGRGEIEYIPFPVDLEGRYQSFTEADISALRRAGFERPFADVATGVRAYLEWLHR